MNTYAKFCPNVFVAKCEEKYDKGDEIIVTTKYWKENACIIYNLLKEDDAHYYYSIVRADWFNSQERAKRKAEKLSWYAENAEKRSDIYYKKSNKDRDFLSLAEPVKIWHHSEWRHRKAIDDAWKNMGKSVEESEKAEKYVSRAEYWEAMANKIDLSMPESIDYFKYELEKATEYHSWIKNWTIKKEHSYSMTYAKKKINELTKKVALAEKLWG